MVNKSLISKGFFLKKNIFEKGELEAVQKELLAVSNLIQPEKEFHDLDECWNYYKLKDRNCAGKIYNAFKHLQSVKRLATSQALEWFLKEECAVRHPALVDINCRIDSYGEEKFLFGWHQDYWFSVCSRKAVVLWIPLLGLKPSLGGLELVSNEFTKGRIFRTKPNTGKYNSYADAVLIDEDVECFPRESIQNMGVGDVLAFSFDVLHRSIPITSDTKSRFTIQLRFSDFHDVEFFSNGFKPGVVNRETVDYLART